MAWPLAVSSDPSRSSGRSDREIERCLGREANLCSPSPDLQLYVVIRSDYDNQCYHNNDHYPRYKR